MRLVAHHLPDGKVGIKVGQRAFLLQNHRADDPRGWPRGWSVIELLERTTYGRWRTEVAEALPSIRQAKQAIATYLQQT